MSELVVISEIGLQDQYSRETLNMNKKKKYKKYRIKEYKTCQKQ